MLVLLCTQSLFALLMFPAALGQGMPPLPQLLSMLLLLLLELIMFPHVVDLQHQIQDTNTYIPGTNFVYFLPLNILAMLCFLIPLIARIETGV